MKMEDSVGAFGGGGGGMPHSAGSSVGAFWGGSPPFSYRKVDIDSDWSVTPFLQLLLRISWTLAETNVNPSNR